MRVRDFAPLALKVQDIERSWDFSCGPLDLEPVRVDAWPRPLYVADPDGDTVELRWYPQDVA
ncbi:hypothetical protein ACFVFQ_22525 [Streptomyces sp. NPDC057743]|uniref:hypothetical protein n=1 Tax=Streptomyces sp. NPDC057743 TaxID=3346236 RepID=UPI00367ED7CD